MAKRQLRTDRVQQLTQTITVLRDELEPEKVELIAAAILQTADAAERLLASGLTRRALVVLLSEALPGSVTKPSRTQIAAVLDALPKLRMFLTDRRPT